MKPDAGEGENDAAKWNSKDACGLYIPSQNHGSEASMATDDIIRTASGRSEQQPPRRCVVSVILHCNRLVVKGSE
jgi:hypothetical protein